MNAAVNGLYSSGCSSLSREAIPTASTSFLPHIGEYSLDQSCHAEDVHLVLMLNIFHRNAFNRSKRTVSCVVEQYIDFPLLFDDLRNTSFNRSLVSDIHSQNVSTLLFNICHFLDASSSRIDGIPLIQQFLSNSFSESRRCTSDQYCLHSHLLLLCLQYASWKSNAKAHREPDLSAIRCSRLLRI